MDHNPNLRPWIWPSEVIDPAGEKSIEHPAKIENLIWQNRQAPPTAYENALGDALEKVFEAGAAELEDVVAKLNELNVRDPEDRPWSEESFAREMKRLGV